MLRLLLPALLPSWRFFDYIAPSPRIEFALLRHREQTPTAWQPFRPLPQKLPWFTFLRRLAWNPDWNESLYLLRCAEMILAESHHRPHAEATLQARIIRGLSPRQCMGARWLIFRLRVITRVGDELAEEVGYTSPAYPLAPHADGIAE